MGVTNYHTINGRIVGQTKNGVRTHYVPDALGSVVATLDANGTVENTYRYKPYGSLLAKTGSGDDPRFMWVGSLGYRKCQTADAGHYVRARHYDSGFASWLSSDPPTRSKHDYVYCNARPVSRVDPSGLASIPPCPANIVSEVKSRICGELRSSGFWSTEACRLCKGDWCKCAGLVNVKGSGEGVLDILDWDGLPMGRFDEPCSLKGSFTCKKEPILSKKTCPPGQRCERPLPGCKFKKTVVLSPADIADSTPVRNPITGTVYNIKWKLTKIKLDVELDMDLYLYGCKGGGCPT